MPVPLDYLDRVRQEYVNADRFIALCDHVFWQDTFGEREPDARFAGGQTVFCKIDRSGNASVALCERIDGWYWLQARETTLSMQNASGRLRQTSMHGSAAMRSSRMYGYTRFPGAGSSG